MTPCLMCYVFKFQPAALCKQVLALLLSAYCSPSPVDWIIVVGGMRCVAAAFGASWHALVALGVVTALASSPGYDPETGCNNVVFERTDVELGLRTMVIEDATQSRSLVLTPSLDKSEPCALSWWLDHNPQGVVRCNSASSNSSSSGSGGDASGSCDAK